MTLTYLARPIDADPHNPVLEELASLVTQVMVVHHKETGTTGAVYEPARGFTASTPFPGFKQDYISEVNNWALTQADYVVALVPANTPSWGVPAEINRAVMMGTPVNIITDRERTWAMPAEQDGVHYCTGDTMHEALENWALQWHLGDGIEIDADTATRIKTPAPDSHPASDPMGMWHYTESVVEWSPINPDEYYTAPNRAHPDDAGWDLYVSKKTVVPPHGFVDVPTNISVQLPDNTWGYLTGRSSALRKHGLLVNPGVIDHGYTGELFSGVQNMRGKPVTLDVGARVAQLIVLPSEYAHQTMSYVAQHEESTRGSNGFGSTGH